MRQALNAAVVSVGVLLMSCVGAWAQSFSCSFGSEPACLDYGAVVCKSSAMCVAKDAVCFDAYTCDFNGFICKSKFDDLVDEAQGQVRKYNTLVDEFSTLKSDFSTLRAEHISLLSDAETLRSEKQIITDCVASASDLEDAQACAR